MLLGGVFLPFFGTVLGASFAFLLQGKMSRRMSAILMGITSGIMMAAATWSLLIPAMEHSKEMGKMASLPAATGFLGGVFFLLLLDRVIPHIHAKTNQKEGPGCHLQKVTMMVLAVALHNFPEGMAVGVVFSQFVSNTEIISVITAWFLSMGIALQNIPEGAIVSLSLRSAGKSRLRSFGYGVLSGIVEPMGAILTILLTKQMTSCLPYLLSFAAGSMVYVIVEELVPESSGGEDSDMGTIGFAMGFVIMMILDVALG